MGLHAQPFAAPNLRTLPQDKLRRPRLQSHSYEDPERQAKGAQAPRATLVSEDNLPSPKNPARRRYQATKHCTHVLRPAWHTPPRDPQRSAPMRTHTDGRKHPHEVLRALPKTTSSAELFVGVLLVATCGRFSTTPSGFSDSFMEEHADVSRDSPVASGSTSTTLRPTNQCWTRTRNLTLCVYEHRGEPQ